MQREPGHVQVVLQETVKTELRLSLVDDSGVFETCGPTVFSSTAVRSQLEMEADHAEQEECIERLRDELCAMERRLDEERQRAELDERQESVQEEMSLLRTELQAEKTRAKLLWGRNCQQLVDHEAAIADKDSEIATLKASLRRRRIRTGSSLFEAADPSSRMPVELTLAAREHSTVQESAYVGEQPQPIAPQQVKPRQRERVQVQLTARSQEESLRTDGKRRGRAPPVDPFTGERPEERLDDWLPGLQRASQWNGWSEQELLLQLAGHLRGTALQ